jgi:hypothetical protein
MTYDKKQYEGWTGCEYRCKQCGHVKFIITNTYPAEIWERCTDECSWGTMGERGAMLMSADGKPTGFHKRRYEILGEEDMSRFILILDDSVTATDAMYAFIKRAAPTAVIITTSSQDVALKLLFTFKVDILITKEDFDDIFKEAEEIV